MDTGFVTWGFHSGLDEGCSVLFSCVGFQAAANNKACRSQATYVGYMWERDAIHWAGVRAYLITQLVKES